MDPRENPIQYQYDRNGIPFLQAADGKFYAAHLFPQPPREDVSILNMSDCKKMTYQKQNHPVEPSSTHFRGPRNQTAYADFEPPPGSAIRKEYGVGTHLGLAASEQLRRASKRSHDESGEEQDPPPSKVAAKGKRVPTPSKPVIKKPKARPVKKPKVVDAINPAGTVNQGRKAGASNYSGEELEFLLVLVEETLPMGGSAWEKISMMYNAWAEDNGFSRRDMKPLQKRYERMH